MTLFPLYYVGAFAFGGVFLLVSLMAGGDDADGHADAGDGGGDFHGDADLDADVAFEGASMDADGDLDGDADGGGDHHGDAHHGHAHELWDTAHQHGGGKLVVAALPTISWFPFRSIRFWVFFLTFFGAAGLLLEGLGALVGPAAAATSLLFGYVIGAFAVNALRQARRADVNTLVSPEELVGKVATVTLPVSDGSNGKIRVPTRTGMEVFLAKPREVTGRYDVQQRVLIHSFDGHRAVVTSIADEE